jgi:pilus assembly protein Flp/PilA
MRHLTKTLRRFLAAEDGPTAVEYAAILAVIIAVCVGAITTVGTKTNKSIRTTNEVYPSGGNPQGNIP